MSPETTKPATEEGVTAAILVIGDEILSGRTKDRNIGHIAEVLTGVGIDLREVRIVPDDLDEIAAAVNALRSRYDYLFTTGGIGPTHDDMTADGLGRAFGLPVVHHPEAVEILKEYLGDRVNEARLRMARMPEGASLVANPVSRAPGFRIENVIAMAGVPSIMHAMLEQVVPTLRTGARYFEESVDGEDVREGDIGGPLATIQAESSGVVIGSYPRMQDGRYGTTVVLRSRDAGALAEAKARVEKLVEDVRTKETKAR